MTCRFHRIVPGLIPTMISIPHWEFVRADLEALNKLRNGGESRVLNFGHGRGHSAMEVVKTVKRNSGIDFELRKTGRRAGDPAELITGADKIKSALNGPPS